MGGAGNVNTWAQEFADLDESSYADWDALYANNAQISIAQIASETFQTFMWAWQLRSDLAALDKGRDLFKRGLLTEAALALEAEEMRGAGGGGQHL
eukprot:gene858-1176_t